jgi:recombination protein RecA
MANLKTNVGTEKEKALELAIDQIEKQFGKGAIMKLSEAAGQQQIAVIPTGSVALDIALGVGGLPRGRVTEVFGPEGSGKTTLGQHIIAQAQHMGGRAAYIDVEHALDPSYARTCGAILTSI